MTLQEQIAQCYDLIDKREKILLFYEAASQQKWDEAERLIRAMIDKDNNYNLWVELGNVQFMNKKYAEARRSYLQAKQLTNGKKIKGLWFSIASCNSMVRFWTRLFGWISLVASSFFLYITVSFWVTYNTFNFAHIAACSVWFITSMRMVYRQSAYKKLYISKFVNRIDDSRFRLAQLYQQLAEMQAAEEARLARERAEREYILRMVRSGIDVIDTMSGTEFEERMKIHFLALGWQAETTKATGDYGADLLLRDSAGIRYVAQCKRYSGPVGIDAVQELFAAVRYYDAHNGILITNSTLTKNAQEMAAKLGLIVWDRDILIQQLNEAYDQYTRYIETTVDQEVDGIDNSKETSGTVLSNQRYRAFRFTSGQRSSPLDG
ncbi:restriction endonuclease [Alicyclobacillus sendaiensis]|uniref:restriction endonuclease n=1 Tax=Alicyclobacillus sendaiensis TaxID=192387 RepID=UPI0026F42D7F|nr:restriction endonuclease [Alicyclobacillus sendaiensis]